MSKTFVEFILQNKRVPWRTLKYDWKLLKYFCALFTCRCVSLGNPEHTRPLEKILWMSGEPATLIAGRAAL